MTGGNHFRHDGHTDHVAAESLHHADLSRRFEVRAGIGREDAFGDVDAQRARHGVELRTQVFVIGVSEAEETRAKSIVIRACQRGFRHKADMVGQRNQPTGRHAFTHRTGGIGRQHELAAEQFEGANRAGHH